MDRICLLMGLTCRVSLKGDQHRYPAVGCSHPPTTPPPPPPPPRLPFSTPVVTSLYHGSCLFQSCQHIPMEIRVCRKASVDTAMGTHATHFGQFSGLGGRAALRVPSAVPNAPVTPCVRPSARDAEVRVRGHRGPRQSGLGTAAAVLAAAVLRRGAEDEGTDPRLRVDRRGRVEAAGHPGAEPAAVRYGSPRPRPTSGGRGGGAGRVQQCCPSLLGLATVGPVPMGRGGSRGPTPAGHRGASGSRLGGPACGSALSDHSLSGQAPPPPPPR